MNRNMLLIGILLDLGAVSDLGSLDPGINDAEGCWSGRSIINCLDYYVGICPLSLAPFPTF